MEYDRNLIKDSDFGLNPLLSDSPYRAWTIGMGGSILSSPLIIDDTIIFGSNDTYVYALNLEGEKLWNHKTGDIVISSPTFHKGTVLVGSNDGYLYAFSMNGEVRWKFPTGSKVWATPCVSDGVVYIGSNNGIFYALSIDDGKVLWKFNAASGEFFHSAGIVNDSVIFGNMSGFIYSLSTNGDLLWKFRCGSHVVQSPLITDDKGNDASSFRKRSFEKPPNAKNPRIFIGSRDCYFRCIDAEDGNLIWKKFINVIGGSSPLCHNNSVYFGSYDGRIYALAADGAVKWKFQTWNRIVSSPACDKGVIYCGSSDYNLYAIKSDSGELAWRFLADNEILSSPSIYRDAIYFGSWDCHMYALSIKDRQLLWKFRTSMGIPSYIKKPEVIEAGESPAKMPKAYETATIKDYQIERSNYQLSAGELTNTFYGSPVAYKTKPAYKGKSAYKK